MLFNRGTARAFFLLVANAAEVQRDNSGSKTFEKERQKTEGKSYLSLSERGGGLSVCSFMLVASPRVGDSWLAG